MTADSPREAGRDGTAARQAALPADLQALHRVVLELFLDTGQPPHRDDLRPRADGFGMDVDEALRTLAEADIVHSGLDGRVVAAYPFSGRHTGHTVHLDNGPPLQAMCAIDALGIPLMTGRDGVITSTEAATGHPIRVENQAGQWHWDPVDAVVLLAHSGGCGPAADCLCPSVTFHTNRQHAQAHLARHPGLHGCVLDQAEAIQIARLSFAALLTGSAPPRDRHPIVSPSADHLLPDECLVDQQMAGPARSQSAVARNWVAASSP
jgi:alkylmercury lyase